MRKPKYMIYTADSAPEGDRFLFADDWWIKPIQRLVALAIDLLFWANKHSKRKVCVFRLVIRIPVKKKGKPQKVGKK